MGSRVEITALSACWTDMGTHLSFLVLQALFKELLVLLDGFIGRMF
jgi:hypothetical protein